MNDDRSETSTKMTENQNDETPSEISVANSGVDMTNTSEIRRGSKKTKKNAFEGAFAADASSSSSVSDFVSNTSV